MYIISQFGKVVELENLLEQSQDTQKLLNGLRISADKIDKCYEKRQSEFSNWKADFWYDFQHMIKKNHI